MAFPGVLYFECAIFSPIGSFQLDRPRYALGSTNDATTRRKNPLYTQTTKKTFPCNSAEKDGVSCAYIDAISFAFSYARSDGIPNLYATDL
jgi:hypothetical protein